MLDIHNFLSICDIVWYKLISINEDCSWFEEEHCIIKLVLFMILKHGNLMIENFITNYKQYWDFI